MSAKWEKQEGNEGLLTFEVSPEKFEEGLDEAFVKVVKDMEIPGFRKGRIPRGLFESRFGVESLFQDAIDAVLPEVYASAVEESGIEPVDRPSIDFEDIERGKPITFKATVTVKPEVTLGDYKGLEVEVEKVEVTEEDVTAALETLRNEQAELIVKEEGAVVEGDTVVIDFEGFLGEEAFPGGAGENYSLEIGSGQFIPGFEEELIGRESGVESEVKVNFPEDYHEESLAGKEAIFKVTIHEIKAKEVPELDDEFAKDQDAEDLNEFKQKTKETIEAERKQEADNNKREAVIAKAADNATVEIPEAMIEVETERLVEDFQERLKSQGMTMEMFTNFSGQTLDDVRKELGGNADRQVKTTLVLEAIIEAEGLDVTEADLEKEYATMAEMYGTDVTELKNMLGNNVSMVEEELRIRKAIDFIIAESKEA